MLRPRARPTLPPARADGSAPDPEAPLEHIIFLVFLLAAAAAFAALEIQIEGAEGWARSLPTWRYHGPLSKVLLGGREVTGYHVFCHLFVLVMVHLPYGLGFATPSWTVEARILAFLLLFWVLEDFLWFLLNPAYRLRGFNPRRATWHARSWWWIMPREYWIGGLLGLVLYAWSVR